MMSNVFRTRRSWRFFRICSVITFIVFIPSYSEAKWSPNFDQTITDPQQIKAKLKLSSEIQLHPGINDVTFFGVGNDSDGEDGYSAPSFISGDSNVPLVQDVRDTDVPVKDAGKIFVWGDYSATGCPIEIFSPSAGYNMYRDFSLMPLGSFHTEISDWSPYSDDPNCGNAPIKTIKFYQGFLEGVPTTFMLISDRHADVTNMGRKAAYDIQILVFSTHPVGRVPGPKGWLDAPAPYFAVFGRYTTSALYVGSDNALSAEFALPKSKTPEGN